MPELERPSRSGTESNGTERGPPADAATTLEVAGSSVSVEGDPTEAEAAALAAVLAEHLRAEAEAEAEADEPEPRFAIDPWCLAGRLRRRSRSGVPAACPSGREWKVAGRASTW